MKKTFTVDVELQAGDNEKDLQGILNNYFFTSAGIRFLDTEMKKPVSMIKAACAKFLKKK